VRGAGCLRMHPPAVKMTSPMNISRRHSAGGFRARGCFFVSGSPLSTPRSTLDGLEAHETEVPGCEEDRLQPWQPWLP
jgi:hypothetical protein